MNVDIDILKAVELMCNFALLPIAKLLFSMHGRLSRIEGKISHRRESDTENDHF